MVQVAEFVAERCDFSIGDYIDNKYKVESFLGEGSFGKVFKVTAEGEVYALKLLKLWMVPGDERLNLLKRFEREYETGLIDSDYLVRSVAKGMVNGNAYMVMEFCPNGDLVGAVEKGGVNLTLVATQVLLGLRDLHAQGKVHRDLKPENVLMRSDNHAVLTDFGIAGDRNNRLTQRNWKGASMQVFGTLPYMPYEQLKPTKANATVLPTTDIFSFGVMIYYLITGNFPFGKLESEADIPTYLNNVPKGIWDTALLKAKGGGEWENVLSGCLEPDFKKRLQSVDDVLRLLPVSSDDLPELDVIRNKSIHKPICNINGSKGYCLRVMQGEEIGRVYNLEELFKVHRGFLTMGRKTDSIFNAIDILETESSYVSRKHCTLEKSDNALFIRDGQYRVECSIALCSDLPYPCKNCPKKCEGDIVQKWSNSLNGTYVNSTEVNEYGMKIKPGDIISIGDVKLRLECLE